MKLKMGTRRSLLARAQSGAIRRALESKHPGLTIETIGIETKGDQIVDVPLRLAEGKDFFVAELDQALQSGEIDFAVHSLKDLSLTRPEGLELASVPLREDPRDCLILSPLAENRLKRGEVLSIGSSSPRRLENAPSFLLDALPRFLSPEIPPKLSFLEIRGNVNTRLARLHLPESDPKRLDGVLLAVAGLVRLLADEEGSSALQDLFRGTRKMILPLRENPTAPGQGALALECRTNDTETKKILRSLHDEETAQAVRSERELFARYGGGCHQRFGVTEIPHPELGNLRFSRGISPEEREINLLEWDSPLPPPSGSKGFDASLDRGKRGSEERLPWSEPSGACGVLFVSHERALSHEAIEFSKSECVLVSGSKTFLAAARNGIWVSASAEGLGEEWCRNTLPRKLLGLPDSAPWRVLTHLNAKGGRKDAESIPTYRIRTDPRESPDLSGYTHFFWMSAAQFEGLRARLPKGAHHASGPGKTAAFLREEGIPVQIFPSRKEWNRWMRS